MRRETVYAARSIARSTLGTVNRPRAEARFRRAITAAGSSLRICAGAGKHPLDGWLNTDVSWHAEHYLDLTKPWKVPPGLVSHVYMDNVIEHFPLQLGRRVLANAHDALRPGGVIRLATPDVEQAAVLYLERGDFAHRALLRNREAGYQVWHPVDLLRVLFTEADHHLGYLFDEQALTAELRQAGFTDVRRYGVGDSDDPAFKGLEARTGPEESATSLVLEARRPA
jgi:predicted SAM-dependent methyltransferase